MKNKKYFVSNETSIILIIWVLLSASQTIADTTTVHFRIVEKNSEKIIPAMICITDVDGNVYLPPNGKVSDTVSTVHLYFDGVDYIDDKSWVGPVRKMQNIGNNYNRSYVYGMLPSVPYWKEPVMYMVSGDFTIKLTAGKWRIAVDHGMEYKPVVVEFELTAKAANIEKTIELERWINLPEMGWWSGDVHVHHPTTEKKFRHYLIKSAKAVDLHVTNILEMGHHKGTEFHQEGFGKEYRVNEDDYWLVSGQEDPRNKYGHIVGLNIQSIVRDTSTYELNDITFKGIHTQPGALVGYAHFSWNGLGINEGLPIFGTIENLDFIELLQFSKMNTLGYYDYLNMGFKLTAAAGSDMPWGSNMGEVRTYCYIDGKFNVDNWFNSISKGNTFVSNGPALFAEVDKAIPGTEIIRKKGDIVIIEIKALGDKSIGLPTRLQLISNNGVLKEVLAPNGKSELSISIEIEMKESQWITAYVECNNGAIAHTTPVYVAVDGKPTWSKEKAPKLILSQLEILNNVTDTIEKGKSEHGIYHKNDEGMLERIESAIEFYQKLLNKVKKD